MVLKWLYGAAQANVVITGLMMALPIGLESRKFVTGLAFNSQVVCLSTAGALISWS
jgi:hypothetical protein